MHYVKLPPIEELEARWEYLPLVGWFFNRETGKRSDYTNEKGRQELWYGKYRRLQASRVAYYLTHGVEPGEYEVEHKNRDATDNRAINLRLANRLQNCANRGKQRRNTSGYKGVTLHKQTGRWQAKTSILRGDKREYVYLGLHDTPEEAHEAYVRWVEENHPHPSFIVT